MLLQALMPRMFLSYERHSHRSCLTDSHNKQEKQLRPLLSSQGREGLEAQEIPRQV